MAKTKVNNIVRFEHGTTDRPGILSCNITHEEGDHLPDIDEGELYAKGADNIGTPGRFPCTFSVLMENLATFSALLTASAGSTIFVGNAHGSNTNEVFTIANALYTSGQIVASRQADAQVSLNGIAYSSNGTTHPFSRAASADTTGPTGTKVKGNNIVSLTHTAIPVPGVLSVTINILRGNFLPDFDEGEIYPVGADLVGTPTPQYPVLITLNMENMQAAGHIGNGADDLVVVLNSHGGATDKEITVDNVIFNTGQSQMLRQQDGSVNVSGFAYSDDGTTLPFALADVS